MSFQRTEYSLQAARPSISFAARAFDMGFSDDVKLTLLLTRKHGDRVFETSHQLPSVKQAAHELVGEIYTALGTATETTDIEDRNLHIESTRAKVLELKRLAGGCRELRRADLEKVELQILQIEEETRLLEQQAMARRLQDGQDLEKRGLIKEAVSAYEKLVAIMIDTPFIYRRLAILYRRLRSLDDEIRVLRGALRHIPKSNRKHYEWFKTRLLTIERSVRATEEIQAG